MFSRVLINARLQSCRELCGKERQEFISVGIYLSRRIETLACVETHRSLIRQTFANFILQMGLLLLLYNIFCFAMWVFDGSVWKRYERFIEHLKTTDSRQSTKVLWRTTFYLDSVRILLWLCIMFNEESTVAQREYYIIFFAKLSCDLVYFVLESSSSR